MRSKISQTLTSGKMKMMTPLIEETVQVFISHLSELAKNQEEFEVKVVI